MSSWREKRVGGAVLAATMLLAAAVLAGCGGSGSSVSSSSDATAQTAAASAPTTSTATGATTSTTHSKPAASTQHAPQQPPKASTSPSSKAPAPAPGGHLLRHFAGSGNAGLGTLVIRSRSVLSWNAAHPSIQIFTARGFLLVSSHASSGSVQLSRGTYTGMRVATRGGWSIELRTRS